MPRRWFRRSSAAGRLPARPTAGTEPGEDGPPPTTRTPPVDNGVLIDWSAHLTVGGRYRADTPVVIKGEAGMLCPPVIRVGMWGLPDPWEDNRGGVPVVGLSVDLLADVRRHEAGSITGNAAVQGVWDGVALQVTGQRPWVPVPEEHRYPTEVPGPPPAGGWPRWSDLGGTDAAGVPELAGLIAARPDVFGSCLTVHPTLVGAGIPVPDGPEVYLISAFGDQDAARRMVEEVFRGSFFLVPMSRSRAEVEKQFERLKQALMAAYEDDASDIDKIVHSFGPHGGSQQDLAVWASAYVLSPQVQAFLDAIPGPPICAHAWLAAVQP